jgi:hypothetical protein
MRKTGITAERPDGGRPGNKPQFEARDGLSTDFSDIKLPDEPALTFDQACGVEWCKPRGFLVGVRIGTRRQRLNLRKNAELLMEHPPEGDGEDALLDSVQPYLVLPDPHSPGGVRQMTRDEMDDRIDVADVTPLIKMAFPELSPMDRTADPNSARMTAHRLSASSENDSAKTG